MDLQWGMFPDFNWSLLWLIPLFFFTLWLAKTVDKRVLWLLPALVLYFFVGWELNGWLKVLFWILFWGGVIIAIVTAFWPGRRTRLSRLPLALMVILIISMLVFGTIGGTLSLFGDKPTARPAGPEDKCLTINGNNDRLNIQTVKPKGWSTVNGSSRDCIDPKASETQAPTSTPSSTVTEEPEEVEPSIKCPEHFVQDLDPNFRQRAVTEGFEGLEGEKRSQTLEAMARDYRYLDAVGDFVFDRDYDASTLHITHDDVFCLSKAGQNLYYEVKGALMASSVRSGLAPSDGYNSGFKDRVFIIRERQGVRGDRRATIYTLSDGRELVILDRCGNIVFPQSHRD